MNSSTERALDIIVPTYNRPDLLVRLLGSLADAPRPPGLRVDVFVIDNNSGAEQAARNQRLVAERGAGFHYLSEPRQGSSQARNTGIAAGSAPWVAFLDDDERISPDWYRVLADEMSRDDVDFVAGPYIPDWEAPAPPWLPARIGKYRAVIGWVQLGDRRGRLGVDIDGMAMAGNMAVKREWLDRVGPFATHLGRSGNGFQTGGDQDMFDRLVAAGARGWYQPALEILHHVPTRRMTRQYHRRWALWHGASDAHLPTARGPQQVPTLLGIPRWLVRRGLSGGAQALRRVVLRDESPSLFAGELAAFELLGWIGAKAGVLRLVDRGQASGGAVSAAAGPTSGGRHA